MNELLSIAVCDDDRLMGARLERIFNQASYDLLIDIKVEVFLSGMDLCKYLSSGEEIDLIFLDIEMESMNGIEAGKRIREQMNNNTAHIVYMSEKESYAMQLFATRPLNFLIKPLQYRSILSVLRTSISLLSLGEEYFEYKIASHKYKVCSEQIMYFESKGKKINIVLVDGVRSFYGKLSIVEEQLNNRQFISIHKSYLVNLKYIVETHYDYLMMENEVVLPVSRKNRKTTREILFKTSYELHKQNSK
ncbi:LytR/AlgR family response regulator transcription factor [Paenibacillus sp. Root52]|uniref:LytR/AlgR family response regulator transcription factor n=1 Tax=Paenibacillus sp. Root52 TaxID=1736552 RepID=UPI0022863F11|nr:LytTR family DNA-binding domain-containing protein [Paenibacillus sp. Root52]